jgi:hypothetical protein
MTQIQETQEGKRLAEDLKKTNFWKRWGSYLSDRQWGTVREDYSADGTAWKYFPMTRPAPVPIAGEKMG